MGSVVAAFDTTIRRRVAIKIANAPPVGDVEQQKAFQRFRREAQLAGGLKHPNIVGIYDFGEDANAAWMVMEIVEGGSLRELLNRNEALSIPETVRLMVQVLDGLAYCHDQGVVHCDIKPANIMLTESSTEGEVKLADFGIARRVVGHAADTEEATRVFSKESHLDEDRIGTPAYMAPEQFSGGTLNAQTDIWAAGVLLYQLLTRENPFKGDPDTIEAKVLGSEPTPPSKLSVLATPAFDSLVRQALSKRPQDRFTDARSFAAKLLEATRARRVEPLPSAKSAAVPAPVASTASKGWIKYAAAGGVVAGGLVLFLALSGGPAPVTPATPQAALVLAPQAPFPRSEPASGQIAAPNQSSRSEPSSPAQVPVPQVAAQQAQAPRVDPSPSAAPAREPPAALTARPEPRRPEAAPAPPSLLLVPAAPGVVPAAPAVVPAPPDPALRERGLDAALRGILQQERCGLLEATREGERVNLSGFIHQREVPGLTTALAAAGITPRFTADVFDAPYCDLLNSTRQALATGDALPRISARSRDLRGGERLTLDLTMPDWVPTVSLWFVMHDGQALRLLEDLRLRPGERRMMNETAPNFPWLIGEPFGHELVLLVASEGQLFDRPRPQEESTDALASALRAAAQRARDQGRRLVMRAIMVETKP